MKKRLTVQQRITAAMVIGSAIGASALLADREGCLEDCDSQQDADIQSCDNDYAATAFACEDCFGDADNEYFICISNCYANPVCEFDCELDQNAAYADCDSRFELFPEGAEHCDDRWNQCLDEATANGDACRALCC